ncbi:MAG: hypothetical protein R3B49_05800 [Phycisphaerales bacterium]
MRTRRTILGTIASAGLAFALVAGGCSPYQPSRKLMDEVYAGQFANARAEFGERAAGSTGSKDELLVRMKAMVLAMADGVPDSAARDIDRVYELLRTQGLNRDAGGGTVLVGEKDSRFWKGEPFEQAMAYHMIAVNDALHGDWDNARADSNNALFLLKDFSDITGDRTGVEAREKVLEAAGQTDDDGLGVTGTDVVSDFEPAYVMKAIACQRLGLASELDETIGQMLAAAPHLAPLADRIRAGGYDTVIIADYGMAPEKVAAGEDGVLVGYRERTQSDNARLLVTAGGNTEAFDVVTDLNRLANDLKWNNLEDVRKAKSTIGSALVIGGVGTAALSDHKETQLAGLGAALAGAILKGTSSADTRHCEILPQRTYIALARVPEGSTLEVMIEGKAGSRLVLNPALPREQPDSLRALYVRLPGASGVWTTSGVVRYSNDELSNLPWSNLPWILGGRDVRTPTWDVLADYQDAGLPRSMTLQDLEDLYRDEGIEIVDPRDRGQALGRHVLEGGGWLYTPRAGSTGFARLYGQDHAPYRPKSEPVRALAEQIRNQLQGVTP